MVVDSEGREAAGEKQQWHRGGGGREVAPPGPGLVAAGANWEPQGSGWLMLHSVVPALQPGTLLCQEESSWASQLCAMLCGSWLQHWDLCGMVRPGVGPAWPGTFWLCTVPGCNAERILRIKFWMCPGGLKSARGTF